MQVLCQAELQPQAGSVLYQTHWARQSPPFCSGCFGGGFPGDSRGVAPQAFEVVERPGVGLEDVDDHVSVVEEHPLGFGDALLPGGASFETVLDFLGDFVGEALHLSVGGAGGDDENSGDLQKVPYVEQHDIGRLLVVQRVGGAPRQIDRFGGELRCDRSAFLLSRCQR